MGRPPSDRTLNFSLIEVKAMLNWAVDRDILKRNPLRQAKQVAVKARRETKVPLTELERLLLLAGDLRNESVLPENDDGQTAARLKAFILCCFDSMLRHGEAAALRWERIGEGGLVELLGSETKSGRRRIVILTRRTLDAIAQLRRVDGSPFVFARPRTGRPFSPNTWRRWFQKTCERAGLQYLAARDDGRIHIHDLRASGATTADLAGARPLAIKTALGHASLKTTEVYLRADDVTNAREIAGVMEGAVIGPEPPRHRRGRPPGKREMQAEVP